MEKLEHELVGLRARAAALQSRHKAAEAASVDAEAKLQQHLLEADLDADEKARNKLEATVAACALTRDNFAKAIADNITAERAAVERKAASDKLARDLDAVERALPDHLSAAQRLVDALEKLHFHFESGAMARFVSNTTTQVEVAAGFALAELRGMAGPIREGAAPIPAAKPADTPIAAAEPAPPTQTVFMLKSAKFREHDGRSHFAGQWEDATMPVATAQRALGMGIAVPVTDPRRAQLRGTRGGDFSPQAPDVVDLDAMPQVETDPVMRAANFTVIDRSAEARTGQISVRRV
ncbi:hypothetical protein IVB14_32725 [Bradyrhizobium sp. 180]|uniref:hypothetical protein n=1 Tax=Bradyrhizobium sp. 180 TaxID=2782650 RepID=UPI001FF81C05|nr:hypothetical protein [Bradyrhizobium sp. 180]MCK1495043.1 hypothetical protein [Bradyrhizobium sp. 180]